MNTPDQTQKNSSELTELLHLIAHDFSAPVRAMVEFSKILEDEYADKLEGDGSEYLHLIITSGAKLQAMLYGLSEFANTQNLTPQPKTCDLQDCYIQAKDLLQSHPAYAVASFEADALPTITADPQMMTSILSKLMANSLTYQPKNHPARIHVSAKETRNGYEINVRDNGIGIAENHYETIFKPFKRLHTDQEYTGTGMGLPLARHLTHLNDGTLCVTSSGEQGTVFTLTLPQKP